jgi:hypothetical protein
VRLSIVVLALIATSSAIKITEEPAKVEAKVQAKTPPSKEASAQEEASK